MLTLSEWTCTNTYANSVDPDETACNGSLISIYDICHSVIEFGLTSFFVAIGMSKLKNGGVHYLGMKEKEHNNKLYSCTQVEPIFLCCEMWV